MRERPVAFHDFRAEDFPFVIEFLDRTGRVVWSAEVTGPGAVEVPALAPFYGPMSCQIRFPGGGIITAEPPAEGKS